MIEHDVEYVLNNMRAENKAKVTFTTEKSTVVWEFIPISECRDYDGTPAEWRDRPGAVLQKMFCEVGKDPVYTNFWNSTL